MFIPSLSLCITDCYGLSRNQLCVTFQIRDILAGGKTMAVGWRIHFPHCYSLSLCFPTLSRAKNQSQCLPETHFLTCQMPGVSRIISRVTSNSNDLWLDSIPSVKVNRASLLCFTVYSCFFWGHYPPNGTTESTWESRL